MSRALIALLWPMLTPLLFGMIACFPAIVIYDVWSEFEWTRVFHLYTFQIFAVVHDWSIIIANLEVVATLAPLVTLVKVVLPISWDVAPFYGHIPVPVCSGVFVEESCNICFSVFELPLFRAQFFKDVQKQHPHYGNKFDKCSLNDLICARGLPRLCMNSWHRFPQVQ